ncbi:MAG: response regulator [Anaerolineae bacterium]|nr:response regulator [Anaerolineae bacterium]
MVRILLVEDDERTREAMSDLLLAGGHEVIEAENGEQGLALSKQEKPDVILLDFSLPKMHGWAVAQEIRNTLEIKDIPIIALTAHVMVATKESAMEVGCDAYLAKPINIATFEPWFNNFLEQKGLK